MIAAIILAAGKGTRLKSKTVNKVTLPFLGKPMIKYGIDLLGGTVSKIVIVVGAFSHSVKDVVNGEQKIIYVHQKKRLGTAHALRVGMTAFKVDKPEAVIVGYGDHMMFYSKTTIKDLLKKHKENKAVASLITTILKVPQSYGRIIRDKDNQISDIVEVKDATEKQKKIKEINAGLYCFDYNFLLQNINKVKKSPVTNEYYINELIKIAAYQGKKVIGLAVSNEEVGIGVNRYEELVESQALYKKLHDQ